MVMLEIVAVPAFTDNYIWLVHDADSGETAVVDPGDAAPVLAEAERRGWTIAQMWNTHQHRDHTGGNLAVKEATGAPFPARRPRPFPAATSRCPKGASCASAIMSAAVIEVPGHTLGHIAFIFEHERMAFVGDTLFAMGCGRLFEGTPEQMFASLQRLAACPTTPCSIAPTNIRSPTRASRRMPSPTMQAIAERLADVEAMREARPDHLADDRRRGTCNQSLRSRRDVGTNCARCGRTKDSFRS